MAFNIRLLPSGHQFIVARDETILEAALRFGLSIQCSCANGTCGKCKARIVEGEPGEIKHFDYILSAAEKTKGTILLCRTMAVSDMVIEAHEASGVADIPRQQITATVARLKLLTSSVMMMELRTPRSQTLQFLAGQHVTLVIDGAPVCNQSIASCPCNGMVLQFHVHRTPGDPFTEFVFSGLKPRQKISVEGPFGSFVLDEETPRPAVFIAYETGFAPIKSVIEHAIALEWELPMSLYWVADGDQGHYQANYCRSWQDALEDFRFVPLVAVDGDAEQGLLQAARAAVADVPDLGGHDVYLNGPPLLAAAASRVLLSAGVPRDRLFIDNLERF